VNVLVRTAIMLVAGMALYVVYYKTAHLFLGTQKGFSHPQQFPMIPTIWLINIWLVHHWFMDNWPGWKMVPRTADELARVRAEEAAKLADVRWSTSFGGGLATGVAAGVALYVAAVWLIPVVSRAYTIIK
jgi:AAT family amino acid transporter